MFKGTLNESTIGLCRGLGGILLILLLIVAIYHPIAEASAREHANRALMHAMAFHSDYRHCIVSFPIPARDSRSIAYAREQWEQVGAAWPEAFGRFRQLAILSFAEGDLAGARSALDKAHDPISRLWLVRLFAAEGRFADAARYLAQDYPIALQILISRGWTLADKTDYDDALVCFEIGAQLETEGGAALIGRGRVRQLLGQYPAAQSDFEQAIVRCPTCYQAYLYRGQTLLTSGHGTIPEIEADFRRAVALAPDQLDALLQWGYWLRDRGKGTEAEAHFQKAARLYPAVLEPVLAWADLACTNGSSVSVAAELEAALTRFPDPKQSEQIQLRLNRCRGATR